MSSGLSALAVRFPSRVMTNAHWREHHPEMVAELQQSILNRTWSPSDPHADTAPFDRAMAPFLDDPFRGCRSRRWLDADESTLGLELEVARDALAAAALGATDVDWLLAGSFPSDQCTLAGNAAFLANALELSCPTMNLESACAGSLLALDTACALVDTGRASRVLVVTSCSYSRVAPCSEVISLANGDGACAMIVERLATGGLIASHTVSTSASAGALITAPDLSADGEPCLRMRLQPGAGAKIRAMAAPAFRACVDGVLARAGVALDDIAFFAFNAATAWMVPMYVAMLGIDPDRTVNTHAELANTGPVLTPTSLYVGAAEGKLRPGDRVLTFAIGNASNAVAQIHEWGEVAIGVKPALRANWAVSTSPSS